MRTRVYPIPTTVFARQLDALFRTKRHPSGREYTYTEVSRLLEARFGETLNPSYLGKLRTGAATNPTRDALGLLCRFFDVPVIYFFPEFPANQDKLFVILRQLMRKKGVNDVVADDLLTMIQHLGFSTTTST